MNSMTENMSQPYEELFLFTEEFGLQILLDKPFKQMSNLVLLVRDNEGVILGQEILENIHDLSEKSAKLLNELSKNAS